MRRTAAPFATLEPLEPLMDKCVHCGFCLPDLSELPAARPGDGFAARAHLPDEGGRRGPRGASSAGVVAALRYLPGLHGVRNGVPVRRAVRAAHRGDARGHRASPPRARSASGCSGGCCSLLLPYPARLRLLALPLGARATRCARSPRLLPLLPRRLRNLIDARADASRSRRADARRPSDTPAAGARPAARRPAHRLRAARVLRPRQRGDRRACWRPKAARCMRAAQPGLLRRAGAPRRATTTTRATFARALIATFERVRASTRSSSTPPAADRR